MKKQPWKIVAVVGVVLLGASIVYANAISRKANEGIVLSSHIKGNPDAAVTLTEYSDFQCPACGQFYPVVKDVLDRYGDQIAFEYKHFPLISIHQYAVVAAKAAEAAGQQGKFFEMHDTLFENQTVWSKSANPTVCFVQYAEEIGLDVGLFKRHMKSSLIADKIDESYREARDRNLTSTPSFFLNGQYLSPDNFKTMEGFVAAIESALGIVNEDTPTTVENIQPESDVQFGL